MSYGYNPHRCAKYFMKNYRNELFTCFHHVRTMDPLPESMQSLVKELYRGIILDIIEYFDNTSMDEDMEHQYEEFQPLIYCIIDHDIKPFLQAWMEKDAYTEPIRIPICMDQSRLKNIMELHMEEYGMISLNDTLIEKAKDVLKYAMGNVSEAFQIDVRLDISN